MAYTVGVFFPAAACIIRPQEPEIIWRQLSERLTDALQELKLKTAVVRKEGESGA